MNCIVRQCKSTAHGTNWGVSTVLCSTCHRKARWDVCPLAATLLLALHGKGMQSTVYCALRKSYCRRSLTSADWWVLICSIQHVPFISHIAASMGHTCLQHESAWFPQIIMHYFRHALVKLSLIWILILMFPQYSIRISITKTSWNSCLQTLH